MILVVPLGGQLMYLADRQRYCTAVCGQLKTEKAAVAGKVADDSAEFTC
jgi:hypothetical protein